MYNKKKNTLNINKLTNTIIIMRKILSLIVLTLFFACNSDTKTDNKVSKDDQSTTRTETKKDEEVKRDTKPTPKPEITSTSKSEIVSGFLNNISSLENVEGKKNPIVKFKELAANEANEVMSISKDNIDDVISKAKQYKNCVVTVKDHTIVKISDVNDCKQSGSWAACMPYAKGYIKRGDLVLQEDYINNIIGLPNSQERTAYFFN